MKSQKVSKAQPQRLTIVLSIRCYCHQQKNINNGKPKLPHCHSALKLKSKLSHKTQTKQENDISKMEREERNENIDD